MREGVARFGVEIVTSAMKSERPTVACVVGTRPEAVKLAPVIRRLRREEGQLACRVIGTGQHRDLLARALSDFGLEADRDLGLMRPGQSLADLTSGALSALARVFDEERPDLVLAVGDTTTVFASALACHYARIPFGHVEAGLRTGEPYRPFPEEKNRELTARLAAIHFAPTVQARANLLREGIADGAIHLTGNTVIDALRLVMEQSPRSVERPPGDRFILATAHRRENWGEPMHAIAGALRDLLDRHPTLGLLVPTHPNPAVREPLSLALSDHPRARLVEPLNYPEFVAAMAEASVIVTDSGGVQEEAPALGKPVIVLRPETERPEAGAVLVGTDRRKIVEAVEEALGDRRATGTSATSPFGDGWAAERIARVVLRRVGLDPCSTSEQPPPWPPAD